MERRCGFPTNEVLRGGVCTRQVTTVVHIEMEGEKHDFFVPSCSYHANSFEVFWTPFDVLHMIRDGRISGEWRKKPDNN